MENGRTTWSKDELQIYILLLCANADGKESREEMELIKAKIDSNVFDRIYREFSGDADEVRFEKIQDCVALHDYSHRELLHLKKEMRKIFMSDKNIVMMERNLARVLGNMLY